MDHDTPLSARPPRPLDTVRRRVLTTRQLREYGVGGAEAADRCRPGGPWQQLLPGVFLLHPGPPTGEERLHAALLYTAHRPQGVPSQSRRAGSAAGPGPYGEAMVTGLAALALRRFAAAPPLLSLDRIGVLVPRTRRLRSTGFVQVVRAVELPEPQEVTGVPVAPVPRALADAVTRLQEPVAVRRLLTEAVRGSHCEAGAAVRELARARLLTRPHVVDAVDSLLAEGRAIAEAALYAMVRGHGLPEPVWNVELRTAGGPSLGGVDAYWPEQAVAVEIDVRSPCAEADADAVRRDRARRRELLERLGITVVHLSPTRLREAPAEQAAVVRTALITAEDRDPAAYVVVLPR
ncbi:hypothetical protein [Streptomyces varsoviensis]|uniref:hypothetical protein n=1 Tax=Streptomyces varsoviensis TaxID=67373 RepID=UPI000662C0BD|nr:hypothetical protein [Streptomyces varsoviensis]